MAKLRLNVTDKGALMNDINAFIEARYRASSLGEERENLIRDIQDIVTRVFYSYITPSELRVLERHSCVRNASTENPGFYPKDCSVTCSHYSGGPKMYTFELDSFYSAYTSDFVSRLANFSVNIPCISVCSHVSTMSAVVEEIKNWIEDGLAAQGGLAEDLFKVCDQMGCEIEKISKQYKKVVNDSTTWESAIETSPELAKMVQEETLDVIRKSKIKKAIELDAHAVLFGEEVLKDKE